MRARPFALSLCILLMLTVSAIPPVQVSAAAAVVESNEHPIHDQWWKDWSRDDNRNHIDDQLEGKLDIVDSNESKRAYYWPRAGEGEVRVFVDYDHRPTNEDAAALQALGVKITFEAGYLDMLSTTMAPHLFERVIALPGVVMLEDNARPVPHMNEAVPAHDINSVWNNYGFDGKGSVIAVLDTGIRGDHEGLNDLDDDPFTCIDDPTDPLLNGTADCDPKIIAFYDAVYSDSEQPASESYDSGTHGSHVAGIAAGTGGGQEAPDGTRYIGVAPGAYLINILACCEGDVEDIIEGAQWAIDNKAKYSIDVLTSSLGEQQVEFHVDNDGSSAWSRQMDQVAESGIITTLSAGNEFGGITFAGCNTIDNPGDAELPITVASLDKDMGLAIYSSRGYTSDGRVKPDVAAIGSNIMAPDAATKDGYTSKSGTSMATPLMAGIAALIKQANPDLEHGDVKDLIAAYAIEREIMIGDDPGFNDCSLIESRPDNEFGYGEADPVAFVQMAGLIDADLNVNIRLDDGDEILNESIIEGQAVGASAEDGWVEVKIGDGPWLIAEAEDEDDIGWTWSLELEAHVEAHNTTISARLRLGDSMSRVDTVRVQLVDEVYKPPSEETPWPALLATVAILGAAAILLRKDSR